MNEVHVADQLRGSWVESILLQINEAGGAIMGEEKFDAVTGNYAASREAVLNLRALGLIEQPDGDGPTLTPFGTRVANLIKDSMTSGARRDDAVQRAVLRWLAGRETAGPEQFAEFLTASESNVNNLPATPQELRHAAELLVGRRFVQTTQTGEGAHFYPYITAGGRAALLSNVLISEYGRANATMISYDYSSSITFGDNATAAGVSAGGRGNRQNVVQLITADQQSALAEQIQTVLAAADGLPAGPVRDQVMELVRAAGAEVASPNPRSEVIKDLALKAVGSATVVLGTAAGQQVVESLGHLAGMLT